MTTEASPYYDEAFRGLRELRGPFGRSKGVALNHASEVMKTICTDALSNLQSDQISDHALAKGLEVFDEVQVRTEFFGVLVSGGLLVDGITFNG
jgi:hypothetical protein